MSIGGARREQGWSSGGRGGGQVVPGGEVDPRRPPGSGSMSLQGSPWKPIGIEADPRGYTGGGEGLVVRGGGGQ